MLKLIERHGGQFKQTRVGSHALAEVADSAEDEKTEHDAKSETKIADAIDEECFLGRFAGGGFFVVVTDQEIRAEADAFPAQVQHDQVVAHDQAGHGEDEEAEISEEAEVSRFAFHVTGGEDGDEESDAGDDAEHDGRKRIEKETGLGGEGAGLNPGVEIDGFAERSVVAVGGGEHTKEQREGHQGRDADADPDGPMGVPFEELRAEKSGDGCT
jgi:hypothetical protein